MASQTRAAGRGHKLFTIQSKDSNLIKWPKSPNTLTLVTLVFWLCCQEEENNEAVTSAVWPGRLHQISAGARHRNARWQVLMDNINCPPCVVLCLRRKPCVSSYVSPAVVALTNSWQVSSLNETVMNQILQLKPLELVRLNQRQLLRVYPSNYRVDSSNFNPQPYWNAGCHMGEHLVSLQTGNTEAVS